MFSAITNYSVFRLLAAASVTVLFCFFSAMALVGWTPGQSGLPADVMQVKK